MAGSFLTAATTVQRFRGFHFSPRVLDRRTTGAWAAEPSSELRSAWAQAEEFIQGYDYQLDIARQAALQRLVDRAKTNLAG